MGDSLDGELEDKRELADALSAAARRTYGPRVMELTGSCGRLFRLDYQEKLFAQNFRQPVLVSATAGVGGKLLVALQSGQLRSLGIDLVAQAVNDLLSTGAEPLFFLDRLAVHRVQLEPLRELLAGMADGCTQAGCSLIGGETSESPELFRPGQFDLAGFAIGVAERRRVITGGNIVPHDVVIGLPSNGLHVAGVELARRVLLEDAGHKLDDYVPALGRTVGQELLRATRIYVRPVVGLLHQYTYKRPVRGIAHVTHGGLVGSIRRLLPKGCGVILRQESWPTPPIFDYLQSKGLPAEKMPRLFNMGLGMILIVRRAFADSAMTYLRKHGETPILLGRVRATAQPVEFRGRR